MSNLLKHFRTTIKNRENNFCENRTLNSTSHIKLVTTFCWAFFFQRKILARSRIIWFKRAKSVLQVLTVKKTNETLTVTT